MKKNIALLCLFICGLSFGQKQKIVKPPVFPECENYIGEPESCFEKEFKLHLNKNFNYPKVAIDSMYEGRVVVNFVINKQGIADSISAKGAYSSLENAAITIIEKLPRMNPALNEHDMPVSVHFSIPIVYSLKKP
jgi:protein TonB